MGLQILITVASIRTGRRSYAFRGFKADCPPWEVKKVGGSPTFGINRSKKRMAGSQANLLRSKSKFLSSNFLGVDTLFNLFSFNLR